MRKAIALIFFLFCLNFANAQRFFYVEKGSIPEKDIKEKLTRSSQFVCPSPLGSDYIISSDVNILQDEKSLIMNISLKDTLTSKTVFETHETYQLGTSKLDSSLILRMAINNFIERNLGQIILSANKGHYDILIRNLFDQKDHI